jgi:acyl-CoA synthetase (AMP-forming)/AMP-acid ligase II
VVHAPWLGKAELHGAPIQCLTGGELACIHHALERTAVSVPSRGILTIGRDEQEKFISYGTLFHEATRMAQRLRGDVPVGGPVIIQMEDIAEFLICFWGVVISGAIPMPFSVPRSFDPRDVTVERMVSVIGRLPSATILTSNELCSFASTLLNNLGLGNTKLIAADRFSNRDGGPVTGQTDFRSSSNDVAIYLLTSGSTADPKIIPQTHSRLLARTLSSIQLNGFASRDICLNCFPLDHVVGLIMCHFKDTLLGCNQIIADPVLFFGKPTRLLDWCDRFSVSVTWAPHSAFKILLSSGDAITAQQWDLSNLRHWENCAETVVYEQCLELTSLLSQHGLKTECIKPSWGMAETCSVTLISHALTALYRQNGADHTSVGKPIPGLSVRIVNETGALAYEGEIGKLQVRGDMVFDGYLGRARELDFSEDDWFNTGDTALIVGGEVAIMGREKDIIIINGNNLAASEIERAIDTVSGISTRYTAACAIRDAADGTDKLAVFAVLDGSVSDQNLVVFKIKEVLSRRVGVSASYISFVDMESYPVTSVGKIKKNILLDRLRSGVIQSAV